MKKQLTTIIALALILGSLTACGERTGAGAQPGDQSSVTDSSVHDTENSSTDLSSESTTSETTESGESSDVDDPPKSKPKTVGIYGQTEIPDIPLGDISVEGRASELTDQEALEQCLDSMVFETHTFGEYTIKLVGDRVRTDKANFPGSIFVGTLRVEVMKNGEKINKNECYYTGGGMLTYVELFQTELILLSDKIGSYLDLYELENPVIAMRYYFNENDGREVTKAVGFATIGDDEVYNPLQCQCDKGTGITFGANLDPHIPATKLGFNLEDEVCLISRFAADKFRIADNKTLVDDEAGIKYTFDFSDPYELEGVVYKTEWIK